MIVFSKAVVKKRVSTSRNRTIYLRADDELAVGHPGGMWFLLKRHDEWTWAAAFLIKMPDGLNEHELTITQGVGVRTSGVTAFHVAMDFLSHHVLGRPLRPGHSMEIIDQPSTALN